MSRYSDPTLDICHGYPRDDGLLSRPTVRQRLNGWAAGCQRALPIGGRAVAYPLHAIIELTNQCPLHCALCPAGKGQVTRTRGRMDPLLFRSLLRQLGPYLRTLYLHNWGDPLLHPDVIEMIRYAKRYPVTVGISTALNILPRGMADELVRSGLDGITVSIDGPNAETYTAHRPGGQFQRVINNLTRLVSAKRATGLGRPIIRWQCLVTRHNERQLGELEQVARNIGVDSLVFLPIYIGIGEMFTHSPAERLALDGGWLPLDPRYVLYQQATGQLKAASHNCPLLWTSTVINHDGSVSPCCAVIDPRHDVGNAARQRFYQVWNNRQYRAARLLMNSSGDGKLPAAEPTVPCRVCHRTGKVILP